MACFAFLSLKVHQKMKTESDNICSRREFFKRAAKGILPIVGLMAFGPSLLSSCDTEDPEEEYGGGSSSGGRCGGSCSARCMSTCKFNAVSSPSYSVCKGTCKGTCYQTCKGTCMGSSKGG